MPGTSSSHRRTLIVAAALATALPAGAARVRAHVELDIDVFVDALAPHGEWLQTESLGWVWTPYDVPVGWRPYTDGRWVYADDCGWTFVSDVEWGWAVFHYGRWAFDPHFGWVWVPGTEWAPAWVAWRSGEGYVGWAPLPPQATWHVGVGISLGGVDIDVAIEPLAWSFVEERVLVEPRIEKHVVLPARNITLCRRTTPVIRYASVAGRVVNVSIDSGRVAAAIGRPVPRVRIRDVDDVTVIRSAPTTDTEVAVFRPKVRKTTVEVTNRVVASPRRVEPPVLREVETTELADWDDRVVRERKRLEAEQERERAAPPPGVSAEDLPRRHAEEREELERQQRKQKAVLERWQQRDREDTPKRTASPARKHKVLKERDEKRK
ncbi:MAG: hypothetical protein HY763_15425 [Planctomycetes bacterium]|nr:hypothetical protein [Planctomycetota bacterium]